MIPIVLVLAALLMYALGFAMGRNHERVRIAHKGLLDLVGRKDLP